MELYLRRDFAGASPPLEQAASAAPGQAAPRFFLGICLLKVGRIEEGLGRLVEVIALADRAFLEEARFYRAKGLLAGRPAAAVEELERAAALNGRLAAEARALAGRLEGEKP
jgi:hypothetical protein